MFDKLKLKLKNKLRDLLGIDTIEQTLIKFNSKFEQYKNSTKVELSNIEKNVNHNTEAINTIHRTIENVVHIGTDVRENRYNDGHSWAVVCIEGKANIVKFVDLYNSRDARDILDFLRQFEAGRHCIDTPHSPIFYDNLFKFDKE